jgi:hypothetical protein
MPAWHHTNCYLCRQVEDMVLKGHRAEENKNAQLDVVRKKGKEEDLKIEEIAFITRLEEENKKREVHVLCLLHPQCLVQLDSGVIGKDEADILSMHPMLVHPYCAVSSFFLFYSLDPYPRFHALLDFFRRILAVLGFRQA